MPTLIGKLPAIILVELSLFAGFTTSVRADQLLIANLARDCFPSAPEFGNWLRDDATNLPPQLRSPSNFVTVDLLELDSLWPDIDSGRAASERTPLGAEEISGAVKITTAEVPGNIVISWSRSRDPFSYRLSNPEIDNASGTTEELGPDFAQQTESGRRALAESGAMLWLAVAVLGISAALRHRIRNEQD